MKGVPAGLLVGAFLLAYGVLATLIVSGIIWLMNRLRDRHERRLGKVAHTQRGGTGNG